MNTYFKDGRGGKIKSSLLNGVKGDMGNKKKNCIQLATAQLGERVKVLN